MRALFFSLMGLLLFNGAMADPIFPPGSRIGLVPPSDMKFSMLSGQFENPAKYASVRFRELRPDDYPLLISTITKESPDGQAPRILSREDMTIVGQPALLVTATQASSHGFQLKKWLLAVRDPTLAMFVVVQSIDSSEGYSDLQIREMLKSVVARPSVPIEREMAALPFAIKEKAGFRPVKMNASSLSLTDGTKDALYLFDQPVLTVVRIPVPQARSKERQEEYALKLIEDDPELTDVAVERSDAFQRNGSARHEILATAKDAMSGKPLVLTQTLVFDLRGTLRVLGITVPDARLLHLARFRAFADGVDIKR
jgi:hypothetical protein